MWKSLVMVEQILMYKGKAGNKSYKDKSLQENLQTRFDDIDSLNKYVMKQVHDMAFYNVSEMVPFNLRGIWLSYSSENKGRFDNYRLLTTTTNDYLKTLRQYMKDKLNFVTHTIREDFNRYYHQIWGGDINTL